MAKSTHVFIHHLTEPWFGIIGVVLFGFGQDFYLLLLQR
jgi:hypothetical protein